jgi:hypothetical protein
MEFIDLHTPIIGAKLFKELNDKVNNKKNLCFDSWTTATTLGIKGLTPTLGDGKVIW